MDTKWNEMRVLVSGGTRGIGRAVAEGLVRRGAQVAIVGTDMSRATRVAQELNERGPGTACGLGMVIDGYERTGETLIEASLQRLGGITALVNAAGGATVAHALELPWEAWQSDFAIKFWGYFSLIRAAVPEMPSGGVIVNILGVAGKDPNPRLAAATAINGAWRGLTKILADDLAPLGVRVVAVNPGATETDLLIQMAQRYADINHTSAAEALESMRHNAPLGRLPTAGDVAETVMFLLSNESARLITGTSIDVDGGAHRGPA